MCLNWPGSASWFPQMVWKRCVDWEVWASLLRLMPRQPDPGNSGLKLKWMYGWMDGLYTKQLNDFACICFRNGCYFICIHCLIQTNLTIWWWDAELPLSINSKGEFHSAHGKESWKHNWFHGVNDVAPVEKTRVLRHDESIVWTVSVCLHLMAPVIPAA